MQLLRLVAAGARYLAACTRSPTSYIDCCLLVMSFFSNDVEAERMRDALG
jgi:hypothetical protein